MNDSVLEAVLEAVHEIRADLRVVQEDVKRLSAFRSWVFGIAAAVSAVVSFAAGMIR